MAVSSDSALDGGDGNDDLSVYYARRAEEYERVYEKPERQADLARLHEALPRLLADRAVLEIACGTGYWTQHIATRARSVYATDINEEVLELARRKAYPRGVVRFAHLDIYGATAPPGSFDGGLAAFWWSHVPRRELGDFLHCFHRWLDPGALVVYLDNRYVSGSSTPISRSDEDGNTYQLRSLDDGTHYEVLKNFPDEAEVTGLLSKFGELVQYVELDYFWYVSYRLTGS